jgi:hypothetical protein
VTPAERAGLAERMVPVACDLACRVRDGDADGIARLTASLSDAETSALLVVLAAMVPVDDFSPGDLLEWAGGLETALEWRQEPLPFQPPAGIRELEPCGTRAAYVRHQRRGEPADVACERAAREYYSERYQARKRAEARNAA